MKKLILLALLLSACNSNSEVPLGEPLSETPLETAETMTGIQTREYTTETGIKYSVNFDSAQVTDMGGGFANYHDFEIKGPNSFPGYLSITGRTLDSAGQTPNQFLQKYYAPTLEIPEVTPIQIGENEVYLFPLEEFSSSYTEFAVIVSGSEVITVTFQSSGLDQTSIDADRAVFMDFLESIKID